MKNKLLKIVFAVVMAFSVQLVSPVSANADASVVLPDGTYEVPTQLMKADDIHNSSMAGGALASEGKLLVENGKWYLIAQFQTLKMGTIYGNASQIKYYSDFNNHVSNEAEIISKRYDATVSSSNGVLENQEAVKEVKIPVEVNSKGVYISMFVDFMNYAPDAYIAFSTNDSMTQALQNKIDYAKTFKEVAYDTVSFQALKTAITNAENAIGSSDEQMLAQIAELESAISKLANVYTLANGYYRVPAQVLMQNKDEVSMANSALKGASVKAVDNQLEVILSLGAVTVYGQSAYIDRMEYETVDGTYKDAVITEKDSSGNVTEIQFMLPSNIKNTNIKFYYGGSTRGSAARLSLSLDQAQSIQTSKFVSDGTYTIHMNLWHATNDVASMAASAFEEKATVIVKDGKARVYVSTKKMTMGSISAYMQTMKIVDNNNEAAIIVNKDANGNPTMFAFDLPHENEYINVLVNPMVAMMGNQDIAARIKMDYATLSKINDSTTLPNTDTGNDNVEDGNVDSDNTVGNTSTNNTPSTSKGVATSDKTNATLAGGLLMVSFVVVLYAFKKRICKVKN